MCCRAALPSSSGIPIPASNGFAASMRSGAGPGPSPLGAISSRLSESLRDQQAASGSPGVGVGLGPPGLLGLTRPPQYGQLRSASLPAGALDESFPLSRILSLS